MTDNGTLSVPCRVKPVMLIETTNTTQSNMGANVSTAKLLRVLHHWVLLCVPWVSGPDNKAAPLLKIGAARNAYDVADFSDTLELDAGDSDR